jgi:flagellar assembly factor FliW
MEIKTTRFGNIEIEESKIIFFKKSVLGFPNDNRFILIPHKEGSYFFWLQSIDTPALAFPALSPAVFASDYGFTVDDETQNTLEIHKSEDVEILVIITIPPENPKNATANLLAPVIINIKNNFAAQLVLDPNIFPLSFPIFNKQENAKEEK